MNLEVLGWWGFGGEMDVWRLRVERIPRKA
jgi:hypothetical protein